MTTNINTLLHAAAASDTAALQARLSGHVLVPGTDGYDSARATHNLSFDRKPALVVRPATANDVAESVTFARAQGLELAVKGGGHSVAGHSAIEGGLLIDLSAMRGVTIDQRKKTARVQGGATSGDLAAPAHAYGLSVSTGDTSSVGLGGLVTGGGIGWMARKHGLAIDNLISAQVVTAEGRVLRASQREHQDLFWAIRGGGGNFGVVTEFEFQLWKDGSVFGGALILPATVEVLRGYLEYALAAPDELTTIAQVMKAPPAPFVPAAAVGQTVLIVQAVYAGHPVWGDRALEPLRALARPIADTAAAIPYPVMFNYTAPAAAPGRANVRAMFSHALSDASLEAAISAVESGAGPQSMVQLRPLGGAVARVAPEATAFAHRDKQYFASVISAWQDPAEDPQRHATWTGATFAAIRADAAGAYANFLEDEGQQRVREAYAGPTFARLACVKGKYDPDNVFHNNQNIRPATNAAERAA